jgi:hypothetical protein
VGTEQPLLLFQIKGNLHAGIIENAIFRETLITETPDENCETIIITGRKRSDQKITEVTVALAERSEYIVVELSDSTTEHTHTVDLIEFYFYRQVQAIASAKFSCHDGESLKWQYSARPTGIKKLNH